MWIFYVLFGIVCLYLLYFFCVRKWINPYRTTMVFGKKGSGKSTLLTKLALQHLKKGWSVYSTEHTPGTFYIEPKQVGHVMLKPRSVLLLDEVSLSYGEIEILRPLIKLLNSFSDMLVSIVVRSICSLRPLILIRSLENSVIRCIL